MKMAQLEGLCGNSGSQRQPQQELSAKNVGLRKHYFFQNRALQGSGVRPRHAQGTGSQPEVEVLKVLKVLEVLKVSCLHLGAIEG